LLLILGLAVVLMGAEAGSARAALAADAATPSPSASDFSRSVVGVTGVVVGDAASPSPAPSSTTTPAPIESIAGETSAPYSGATPPPTSSWSDIGGAAGSTPILLLICLALACGLIAAVQYQRRKRLG
jgi:hypothetical protein